MKYKASGTVGDFSPVPAGTHIAVCDIVADIGKQQTTGVYAGVKPQVVIRFQIPGERVEFERDGKKQSGPAVISKTYTASMHEKATMRAHIESWRGREFTDAQAENFDTRKLLGIPCMLTITHSQKNDKTYANISAIGKLMKGIAAPIPEIAPIYYGPDDPSKYGQLPEWIRKKIDAQIVEQPKPSPATPAEGDAGPPDDWGQPIGDGTYITDEDLPDNMRDDSVPF